MVPHCLVSHLCEVGVFSDTTTGSSTRSGGLCTGAELLVHATFKPNPTWRICCCSYTYRGTSDCRGKLSRRASSLTSGNTSAFIRITFRWDVPMRTRHRDLQKKNMFAFVPDSQILIHPSFSASVILLVRTNSVSHVYDLDPQFSCYNWGDERKCATEDSRNKN